MHRIHEDRTRVVIPDLRPIDLNALTIPGAVAVRSTCMYDVPIGMCGCVVHASGMCGCVT